MRRPRLRTRRSGSKPRDAAARRAAEDAAREKAAVKAVKEDTAARSPKSAKPRKGTKLKKGKGKKGRAKRRRGPRLPEDSWFLVSTRFRAIGYWTREKAQIIGRAGARAAAATWRLWADRSPSTKRRVGAVAALLALYSVIKFAPIPFVPCQISAANECAPGDDAVALVPADALLYGHLTLDRDSHQYELASDLASRLPDLQLLLQQVTATLPTPSGSPVEIGGDILPWADGDLAVALLPGPRRSSLPLVVAGVADREGAARFLAQVAPRGKPSPERQRGSALSVYPDGFAAAYAGDELAFGAEGAVRRALDAAGGRGQTLGDSGPRGDLPDVRFADVYLSRAGVSRLLDRNGAGSSQLDTFVDFGATTGFAASATAREDGVEVNVYSDLDPKRLKGSPSVFTELPSFEPKLASEAGERALGYAAVGELGPTLAGLVQGAGGGGLTGSLKALFASLRKEAKVDPLKDLLPALDGEAALVAEPTDGVPFASLIVDGVDEDRASRALAKLQGPLLRSLKSSQSGTIPRFEEDDVDGVSVRSVQISPTVDLAYAVFDGKLVISTDPAGIEQVRSGGDGLAGTDAYERTTDDLPDKVSALVFLNLDELLGLAEEAGLAEDPLYASLSDDISNIHSLAIAVTGGDTELHSELFLATD